MFELLATIIAIAFLGSLGVPTVVLVLARFGYFEPISLNAFGREWNFHPKTKTAFHGANVIVSTVPFQRETVFASVVTAAYTVAAPFSVIDGTQYLETGAMVSGHVMDLRRGA